MTQMTRCKVCGYEIEYLFENRYNDNLWVLTRKAYNSIQEESDDMQLMWGFCPPDGKLDGASQEMHHTPMPELEVYVNKEQGDGLVNEN